MWSNKQNRPRTYRVERGAGDQPRVPGYMDQSPVPDANVRPLTGTSASVGSGANSKTLAVGFLARWLA